MQTKLQLPHISQYANLFTDLDVTARHQGLELSQITKVIVQNRNTYYNAPEDTDIFALIAPTSQTI